MTNSQPRAGIQALWYVAWAGMFLIAADDSLVRHPILSGNACLFGGVFLAILAGVAMLPRFRLLRREEAALSAVVLIAFCVAQFFQFVRSVNPPAPTRGADFNAYYLAGKMVSETPAHSLYQLQLFADGRLDLNAPVPATSAWGDAASRYHMAFAYPYIYPPFFAVLFKPLAHLPVGAGFAVWDMVTVLLVAGAVVLSLSLGGVRVDQRLALVLGAGLFSYFPVLNNLFFGQAGGAILFLLAAGIWLLSRNRTGLSALSIAAATMIKLTPALALPVLVFHRRWKWLMAYAGWMLCLLGISVWQAGWFAQVQFWREVMPAISSGAPACQNTSIMAFVQALFLGRVPFGANSAPALPAHATAISKWVASLVYYLMLARFYVRRRDGDIVRDLVVMVLLGLAISPISWWHHYTLALLPFLYLWCRMEKGRAVLLVLFVAVATNVAGIVECSGVPSGVQLMLAAMVPGLTISVVYLALAARPAGRLALEPELAQTAHSDA